MAASSPAAAWTTCSIWYRREKGRPSRNTIREGRLPQQGPGTSSMTVITKIVLLRRILNLRGREQCRTHFVFVQNEAAGPGSEFAGRGSSFQAPVARPLEQSCFKDVNQDYCCDAANIIDQRGRKHRSHDRCCRLSPRCPSRQFAVAVRDHDVEHPLMPLFFRLDQSHALAAEPCTARPISPGRESCRAAEYPR